MFQLVTKCFNDSANYPAYAKIKKHRTALLKDDRQIEVQDFGAGSRVFKGTTRAVSKIAKNAGVSFKRQRLLHRLVNYFQIKEVLELGTSVGLGTYALGYGNYNVHIQTIEGCPNTANVAVEHFRNHGMENIVMHNETFDAFFQHNKSIFDLVYIDGNHDKEHTLSYFYKLLERVHKDSILIFDDIYWSPEMTEAWNEIKGHEKVTVSIDTFQWGMVFFRTEQPKQHFTLRL
ncbi:MAG: class I SAM-dependent methyltransferase [Aureisphaera sp.]